MKAVILASGYGTRMRPASFFVPKPMIRVCGENFIERAIRALPDEVKEVVLVVGYLKEQIINHFGNCFEGRKISYAIQKSQLGTADALFSAKNLLDERFIVLMGDDYVEKQDLENLIKHKEAVLVTQVEKEFSGGAVETDKAGNLVSIKEGIHSPGALFNTNIFVLEPDVFKVEPVKINEKEYGLPQTVVEYSRKFGKLVKAISAQTWMQVSNTDDLLMLEEFLKSKGKCNCYKI